MPKLVIVESPTKARTIRGFLPDGYHVEASMGHIRDLPASAAEIPAAQKKESWSRLGVNVENDFDPLYVVPSDKKKVVTKLKKELKNADELILATDEDREGESIGWHLTEVLKPKVPVQRMVFHEITKEAILQALQQTRDIDEDLVRAQETRRILDRLVGYTVSPLLWKKVAPKLSAGRVQSVAVRLLVERERERRAFRTGSYWDLKALLNKRPDQAEHRFDAQLHSVGGVRVATGRDFDESTGQIGEGKNVLLLNSKEAAALAERLLGGQWVVGQVDERSSQRSPAPPFTTSTLQQEANRKLGLSARDTMRVAQRLYEQGYITYMRTDSVNLSDEAVNAARRRVSELYGSDYLTDKPRRYKTSSKSAQEAHEAIRPAGDRMLPLGHKDIRLEGREARLYELIWTRTVATQMQNARLLTTTVTIEVDNAVFKASGRKVLFPGYFRAYVEGSDDPDAALDDQESPLPELTIGEEVDCRDLEAVGHETKPPARYTEASLVKALERDGIGRPSTYAAIIDTIQNRGYVFRRQRRELVPTYTAFAVTQLLEDHFNELVDVQFTAEMEQELDEIAEGDADWLNYLRTFYLGDSGLDRQVQEKEGIIDPREAGVVRLSGLSSEVRIGQYGPYVATEEDGERITVGIPSDLPPADLNDELVADLLSKKTDGPRELGEDPETGMDILLKEGPFGPYVQLGDDEQEGKPRRVSLPKGMEPNSVTYDLANQLLSLPRELGEHPDTGKPVEASIGRYGPYVRHDGRFVSIKDPDDVLTIDLKRALQLIAEAPARGRSSANVLKELGEHPDGGPVQVLDGRYGPYVKYQKINATIPKDVEPTSVTLEMALDLIATKAAAKKTPKKSSSRKKTTNKTTKSGKRTTTKSTRKKPATKKADAS